MNNRRVFDNAIWIVGCKIFRAMLGLIVTMLSARYLGPSGYGIINYAASIVTFVVPVMQLGLNSTLVQELLNEPDREGEVMGTSIAMSLVSGLCCIVGVTAFAAATNPGEPVTVLVCALYSIQLIFQALEQIQYWFHAKLLSKFVSVTMLAAYAVTSAYKILLLILGSSVYWFALAQALDFCLISGALLVIYKRMGADRLRFSLPLFRAMFARSKYYIISNLMISVFAQTDRIMLKMMLDETAVGYYSAAVTCAGMAGFVFEAIINSAQPVILESAQRGNAALERSISSLYSVVTYLSLGFCVCITVFAELIIRILYGAEYGPSVTALRLIVWYTTFSYFGAVRDVWILAQWKQKYLLLINLIGAGANIVLNILMIPVMGINGAALASLVTQIFTNVVLGFLIKPIRRNNILMLRGLDPRMLLHLLPFGKERAR
jgi:O-antigen/teichoic acid export membrane protein